MGSCRGLRAGPARKRERTESQGGGDSFHAIQYILSAVTTLERAAELTAASGSAAFGLPTAARQP